MATKLIRLDNGILVEVEVSSGEASHISSSVAERVNAGFEKIEPVLIEVTNSLVRIWEHVEKEMEIQQATVELGVSFEGEGNVFITKAKAGANLVVTLELKPKARVDKE